MKYYKKSFVDAMQYTGNNMQEVILFTNNLVKKHPVYSLLENEQEGLKIQHGDYVVKENGTITIVGPHLFERNFFTEN